MLMPYECVHSSHTLKGMYILLDQSMDWTTDMTGKIARLNSCSCKFARANHVQHTRAILHVQIMTVQLY
jgi:hypothetical protein